eukprot:COSAG01_NODE_645_length_14553_cov_32.925227_7_plen_134_part_00
MGRWGCARVRACRCAQEWEGGSSAFHAQRRRPWGRGGEAIADCTKGLRIRPRAGDAVLFYSMAGAGSVAPPPPSPCSLPPCQWVVLTRIFLCKAALCWSREIIEESGGPGQGSTTPRRQEDTSTRPRFTLAAR